MWGISFLGLQIITNLFKFKIVWEEGLVFMVFGYLVSISKFRVFDDEFHSHCFQNSIYEIVPHFLSVQSMLPSTNVFPLKGSI